MSHILVTDGTAGTTSGVGVGESWEAFWDCMETVGEHWIWSGPEGFADAAPWTAWNLENGKPPEGWSVASVCGVPGCCRVSHLTVHEVVGVNAGLAAI